MKPAHPDCLPVLIVLISETPIVSFVIQIENEGKKQPLLSYHMTRCQLIYEVQVENYVK